MLGDVDVGAGKEHRLVGDLRAGGPHLLTVDDEAVTVPHGSALQAREVGAGVGLREQLAVRVGAVQHPGQQAPTLLVGAMLEHRRRGEGGTQPDRGGHRSEVLNRPRRRRGECWKPSSEPGLREVRVSPSRRNQTRPPLPQWHGRVPIGPQPFGQLIEGLHRHPAIVVHPEHRGRVGLGGVHRVARKQLEVQSIASGYLGFVSLAGPEPGSLERRSGRGHSRFREPLRPDSHVRRCPPSSRAQRRSRRTMDPQHFGSSGACPTARRSRRLPGGRWPRTRRRA